MPAAASRLNPALAVFLMPSASALQVVVKTLVGSIIALYISFELDFRYPYWALFAAIFLQIRPESGLVIEKGIFQLVANAVGGIVAIVILDIYVQSPPLALTVMAIAVFVLSTLASLTPNFNITYLLAMTAIIMVLIVCLSIAGTVTSENIFITATQRVCEVSIGAVSATLASMLLWPQRIHAEMYMQTRSLVNQTLNLLSYATHIPEHSSKGYDELLSGVVGVIEQVESDADPVLFEGPSGISRGRAAHRLSQVSMGVLAHIQLLTHYFQDHHHVMSDRMAACFEKLHVTAEHVKEVESRVDRLKILNDCLNFIHHQRLETIEDITRDYTIMKSMRFVLEQLIDMVETEEVVENPQRSKMTFNNRKIFRSRDLLLSLLCGLRSMVMFSIGAIIWVGTGFEVAFLMMILPVIFSIMFASLAPTIMIRKMLIGMILAFPVALIISAVLLPAAPGDFEIMLLVVFAPMAIIFIGFSAVVTLPITLGFSLAEIIMVAPNNHLSTNIEPVFEKGIALIMALTILYLLFLLIKNPSAYITKKRLISSSTHDLNRVDAGNVVDAHKWLDARRVARIKELASADTADKSAHSVVDYTFIGLALGHGIVDQLYGLQQLSNTTNWHNQLGIWQAALAGAFEASFWGKNEDAVFIDESIRLYHALKSMPAVDAAVIARFEGMCNHMVVILRRPNVKPQQLPVSFDGISHS